MKKIIASLVLFVVFAINLQAQTVDCSGDPFTISNIMCENDVMTFTVTDASACTTRMEGLPPGSSVTGNASAFVNGTEAYFYGGTNEVTAPSIGCVPFDITVEVGANFSSCTNNCPGNVFTIAAIQAPIPTLGQWAVIVLGGAFLIIGVLVIKSRRWAVSNE